MLEWFVRFVAWPLGIAFVVFVVMFAMAGIFIGDAGHEF